MCSSDLEMAAAGIIVEKRPNPRNRKKLTKQRISSLGTGYSAAPAPAPISNHMKITVDDEKGDENRKSKKKRF